MSLSINHSLDLLQLQANSAQHDAALSKLDKGLAKADVATRAQIKKVSEEFESIFLGIVLKSMRDTVGKSGLVDGGNAEDIYRSMLDEEYAAQMAEQRSTGIADNIENFLLDAAGLKSTSNASKAANNSGQLSSPSKALARKAYAGAGLQQAEKQATIGLGALGDPRQSR